MICVTTRFQLKSLWHLLPFLMSYWRMRPDIVRTFGLLRHALLMENPSTWFAFSVWASDEAMSEFANMRSHIAAQRGARRWCRAIWSGYWRLDALSKYAHDWPGTVEWPEMSRIPGIPIASCSRASGACARQKQHPEAGSSR